MSVFRGFPHLLGCHVIHILVKIGSGRFGENCLLKLVLVYLIPTQCIGSFFSLYLGAIWETTVVSSWKKQRLLIQLVKGK